jgi:CRP-like cAMP-binding protein
MPPPRIPIQDFLANLPLFRQLDGAQVARLASTASEITAPRGTVLVRRGDPCEGFHVVVFGRVKLSLHTSGGDEKVVELMGPGQSFGEAVMFLDRPYMVTATALVDSKLVHVPRQVVLDEVGRDSHFARRMLAGLSQRLHQLVSDLEAVSLRSGTERVIGYLLGQLDEGDGSLQQLTLPAKKGVIASRLNLTHEHFSRILHELARRELIAVDGPRIRITDAGKLRDHASHA